MATIFIDLDGTVIDVWERYYQVMADFFADHLKSPFTSLSEYRKLKRILIYDSAIISQLCGGNQTSLPPEILQNYFLHKKQALESAPLLLKDRVIGDFSLFADTVRKKQHKLVLITLRENEEHTREQLRYLNIDHLFDRIMLVSARGSENPKFRALRGIAEKDDWMVGDSEVDIECGNLLGINTVHVDTGMRTHEYVSKWGSATKLGNYQELLSMKIFFNPRA